MSVLDFPVQKASNITRTLRASVAAVASPFTGGQQVQDWGGEWWEYQIDMAVLRAVDGRSLSAFLAQLGGQRGRFLFRDPTIRNTASVGAPVVSGAGQAGNALVTTGWDLARDRRNLLTYTQEFNNAAWAKQQSSVVANAAMGPDGIFTADQIVEDLTTNFHGVRQAVTVVAGQRYSASAFVKKAGRGFAFVGINGGGMLTYASIDLTSGAASLASSAMSDFPAFDVSDAGGGWWRVSVSATASLSGQGGLEARISVDGVWANRSYTGDGTSGIYLWGAQLEAGDLTAYQPIPSPVMYAGQFISIGTGADTRLHQLTADVTPDNSGNATLQIVPRLRPSPADGAVIETANPAVLLRATAPVPAAINAAHRYRVSLTAREAL